LLWCMHDLVQAFHVGSTSSEWRLSPMGRAAQQLLSKQQSDENTKKKGKTAELQSKDMAQAKHLAESDAAKATRAAKKAERDWFSPLRLEYRVSYLTRRFARHAPRWQLVIWLRQIALILVSFALEILLPRLSRESAGFSVVQYGLAAMSVCVLLATWLAHQRVRPYFLQYQNRLESWLYFTDITLILSAMIYTWLDTVMADSDRGSASRDFIERVFEVIMAVTFLSGLVSFGVVLKLDLRKTRKILDQIDTSQVLNLADEKIDQKVSEALLKGHIKLMRCSWLLREQVPSVMPRRQNLEALDEDVFFSGDRGSCALCPQEPLCLRSHIVRAPMGLELIFLFCIRISQCSQPPTSHCLHQWVADGRPS
jgi:hypothetical protein